MFVASFAAVILTGGLLLWFPFSATQDPLRFVDALFTSTSAVCVTGLVVVDTGKDLSTLGQVITMLLIQIGGLGIITFSTVFFVLMGRDISFKGREIVQSTFLHTPRRDFMTIAKAVLAFTLITEAVGALFLFARFSQNFAFETALYQSVYHAISAFNNAGFSLFSDSLIGYQGDLIVNLVIMGLIVHGGIGFIVQYEVFGRLRRKQKKLSVHTKVVLISTAILIASGAFLFYFFERNHIIKDMPVLTKFLTSLFQSVTPRTAGFNTVDIGALDESNNPSPRGPHVHRSLPWLDGWRSQDHECCSSGHALMESIEGESRRQYVQSNCSQRNCESFGLRHSCFRFLRGNHLVGSLWLQAAEILHRTRAGTFLSNISSIRSLLLERWGSPWESHRS